MSEKLVKLRLTSSIIRLRKVDLLQVASPHLIRTSIYTFFPDELNVQLRLLALIELTHNICFKTFNFTSLKEFQKENNAILLTKSSHLHRMFPFNFQKFCLGWIIMCVFNSSCFPCLTNDAGVKICYYNKHSLCVIRLYRCCMIFTLILIMTFRPLGCILFIIDVGCAGIIS